MPTNSSTWMWYASRATGVVSLLLLTTVVLLGLLVSRQGPRARYGAGSAGRPQGGTGGYSARPPGERPPGLPRFALTGLHRNLSLLSVAFIGLHVLTAVADGYVSIPLTSAVIPFASGYERFWLGIGAVSFDAFLAVIVTSLLRRHLSRRTWYAVHLASYASWPIAFVHSLGASRDMQGGWMLMLALACAGILAIGITWRVRAAARDVPRAERVHALLAELHSRRPHRAGTR